MDRYFLDKSAERCLASGQVLHVGPGNRSNRGTSVYQNPLLDHVLRQNDLQRIPMAALAVREITRSSGNNGQDAGEQGCR